MTFKKKKKNNNNKEKKVTHRTATRSVAVKNVCFLPLFHSFAASSSTLFIVQYEKMFDKEKKGLFRMRIGGGFLAGENALILARKKKKVVT